MPVYLFSSQIPELKHLPIDKREALVDTAIFGLPVSVRNLLTVAGVVLPMTIAALALAFTFGRWVVYVYLPLGGFVIWTVFLNLAREKLQELVGARDDQKG